MPNFFKSRILSFQAIIKNVYDIEQIVGAQSQYIVITSIYLNIVDIKNILVQNTHLEYPYFTCVSSEQIYLGYKANIHTHTHTPLKKRKDLKNLLTWLITSYQIYCSPLWFILHYIISSSSTGIFVSSSPHNPNIAQILQGKSENEQTFVLPFNLGHGTHQQCPFSIAPENVQVCSQAS